MKALIALLSIILITPFSYAAEVSEISGAPVLTSLSEEEYAYQYLNITADKETIEFNVNRSWIAENGITSVYLSVYKDGKWNAINTILVESADGYNTYLAEAEIPSYYAVFGKQESEPVPPQTGLITSQTAGITGIVLVLILLIAYKYRKNITTRSQ